MGSATHFSVNGPRHYSREMYREPKRLLKHLLINATSLKSRVQLKVCLGAQRRLVCCSCGTVHNCCIYELHLIKNENPEKIQRLNTSMFISSNRSIKFPFLCMVPYLCITVSHFKLTPTSIEQSEMVEVALSTAPYFEFSGESLTDTNITI